MKHIAFGLVSFTIACGGNLVPSMGDAVGASGGVGAIGGDGGVNAGGAQCAGPTRLATAKHPIAIAIDATNVYWVDDATGTVNEVPIRGGGAKTLVDTTTLGSKTLAPAGIAVAAGKVYFTTTDRWNPDPNGAVWSVPAAGGTPAMLVSDLGYTGPIVVTGGTMVWTDEGIIIAGTPLDAPDGRILQASIDGTARKVLASAQNGPLALTVASGKAVWTVSGSLDSQRGSIVETQVGGGALIDGIAVAQDAPVGVAVQGSEVYWVDSGDPNALNDGRVMKIDPNIAVDPTTLASGGVPQGIAVDEANVYWTDSQSQSVQKVPRTGGAPTTLATRQVGPLAITVDGTNVYWITIAEGKGEGSIMKTCK